MLAIARADFPFKGYLLGLIDEFSKGNIPEKWHLTIITYGPIHHMELLHSKYLQSSEAVKSRIQILGKMKYEDLEYYFNQAHIFVGMGTTLLDASKHGVISIPVEPFNNSVKCKGFFYDNPEVVGEDINDEEAVEFKILLKRFDSLSEKQLAEIISKTSQIVPRYYSIPKTWEKIRRKFEILQKPYIFRISLFYRVLKLYMYIRKIIKTCVRKIVSC